MQRIVARIALVLLVLVLALMLLAIIRRADREPHKDEIEYLHAAWLMSKGETLYVTFFEHHPPFLFAALRPIAGDDIPRSFVRARLLSGVFALVALLAYALIVWRLRPEAAPVALALIFAALPMWMIGLAAVRAEPFALAFFWCGAALVLLPRGDDRLVSLAGGVGAGLVAVAALWIPKWPVSSVVVAAFWLWRMPRRLLSVAVAAAVAGAAVLVLAMIAPLDRVWFFVVEVNRVLWPWLSKLAAADGGSWAFGKFAPGLLEPLAAGIVFALGGAAMVVRGNRIGEKRIALFFLVLACAASIELRFIFPYPMLWPHYYLMWAFAFAALAGLIPAAVETLLERASVRGAEIAGIAVMCTLTLVIAAHLVALAPFGSAGDQGPYWSSLRYLRRNLRPADTVWIDLTRNPVAVRDATYYWFLFAPPIADLRRTPRGARYLPPPDELPYCAVMRGATTSIRYVSSARLFGAPAEQERCFQQLLAAGRIRRTPFAEVFEIAR